MCSANTWTRYLVIVGVLHSSQSQELAHVLNPSAHTTKAHHSCLAVYLDSGWLSHLWTSVYRHPRPLRGFTKKQQFAVRRGSILAPQAHNSIGLTTTHTDTLIQKSNSHVCLIVKHACSPHDMYSSHLGVDDGCGRHDGSTPPLCRQLAHPLRLRSWSRHDACTPRTQR